MFPISKTIKQIFKKSTQMKYLSLLIVLMWTIGYEAESKSFLMKGQIIYANDTVDVTFNIPVKKISEEINFEKLQLKVTYFDSNHKKITLKSNQAKEIRFQDGSHMIRMVSRRNSLMLGSIYTMDTTIFLKIEIDGNLKLFTYYGSSGGMYGSAGGMPIMTGGSITTVQTYILQKGDGPLIKPYKLTFRSDMKKYLSDCPALIEKIDSKEFRNADIESIVLFYNGECGK